MVRVKICGVTNLADARAAVEAGVDALGFNFDLASPRRITPTAALDIIAYLPPFVTSVGVFMTVSGSAIRAIRDYCRLGAVQLHGGAPAVLVRTLRKGPVIRVIRVRDRRDLAGVDSPRVAALLFDAFDPVRAGGTGKPFDWALLHRARPRTPFLLAGGLNPGNVARAIRLIRPYGVDVSSGVERAPGRKDHARMRRFVAAAKSA